MGRSFWPHVTGQSATVHMPGDTAGWEQNGAGTLIRGGYKLFRDVDNEGSVRPWELYNHRGRPRGDP